MFLLLASIAMADPCPWDADALSFAGTPVDQARCLMRPVRAFGVLGAERELPAPLEDLVGEPVDLDRAALNDLLNERGIDPTDIGGPLNQPLCHWGGDTEQPVVARYFVIHDTALPVDEWPEGRDDAGWVGNALHIWTKPIAHIFVSRTGESVAMASFAEPSWWATKFERDKLDRKAGLLINVELVQPRMKHRDTGSYYPTPPDPGFMPAQYERLALLYVAASVRKGEWLIPAFHAAFDHGIPDAHDDPQGFSTEQWAAAVRTWIAAVGVREG